MENARIRCHDDLIVYQLSLTAAIEIHELGKSFPKEEIYSLTDQIRRSSRSVSANIAEAFRKRRYIKSFISKLSDSEAEAAETQVWLKFANQFNYINDADYQRLISIYNNIISKLVIMINNPEKWNT